MPGRENISSIRGLKSEGRFRIDIIDNVSEPSGNGPLNTVEYVVLLERPASRIVTWSMIHATIESIAPAT